MTLSDDQLELLEAYLDGELTTAEEDALRQRLEAESELAAALKTLRGEREVRGMVWKTCEPSQASVAQLISRVERAVDQHSAWTYRIAQWRVPMAAAACIIIGFSVGWLGRGKNNPPFAPAGNTGGTVAVAPQSPSIAGVGVPGVATVNAPQTVDLPISDESGRVIAVQHFKNADEAAKFIEDLTRWQKREEQIKNGQPITPAGSEKF